MFFHCSCFASGALLRVSEDADLRDLEITNYELPPSITHLHGKKLDATIHTKYGKCVWPYFKCNIVPFISNDSVSIATRNEIEALCAR